MSSDTILSVSNLSKCYQIYDRPRHRLMQGIFRHKKYYREFWALRDVSLDVKRGEVLGIIGRNGAGKSTLLQIICGTTTASSGTVTTHGRVAALLELGAGFNPEFTGRENAFLNAAILGMTRDEIAARFSDIVAFAELEEFIDEPVKTYSSGMFVRLAFAVAIHMDPDILVVDEALSVGDVAFRNKCLKRIQELRANGTTILFVSHDLSTLQLICNRAVWLEGGRVQAVGDPVSIAQDYHAHMLAGDNPGAAKMTVVPQQPTEHGVFTRCALEAGPLFKAGEDIAFTFALKALEPLDGMAFGISVYRTDGDWVIGQTSREAGVFWPTLAAGETTQGRMVLESNLLAPGDYAVAFGAYSPDLSLCYALTELNVRFSVRTDFPTWGKVFHPAKWLPQ